METLILFTLLLAPLLPITFILLLILQRENKNNPQKKNLPPGSLGIPYVGQSLGLLNAIRTNTAEEWLKKRIDRHGPVSKLTLLGRPTVFVAGPAANRFVFANEGNALGSHQPSSFTRILGRRNFFELVGEEHKRMRAAVGVFLRPEVLKRYVGKMDEEVREHLELHWKGRSHVKVVPLTKILAFDILSSLIFGLERGDQRSRLLEDFKLLIKGIFSVPIDLPFTRFGRSLRASRRTRDTVKEIVRERRSALDRGLIEPNRDVITSLICFDGSERALTEEEIVDNVVFLMVAGHDTSSVLVTFIVRQLAKDPTIYDNVLREQEEITKNKGPGERLTWEDLSRMKYTWRVAMEVLRMVPPLVVNFRKALKDIEYGGYHIPKGWQILWSKSVTYMDENMFPEPKKFDPTRFENPSAIPPYSYVPFGGGARICPGNDFARIEVLVTIHYLVTQFKWKLCGTDDSFTRNPSPSPSEGLPIQLEQKIIV
ncbi:Cytochrome P450 [Acorus gramineus]|uniref:Cytochrome P450 n=1 Tax=Acorus gramineus TaxID=55184 RepID=A0AAV9BU69_ACOGR|nr:Cytochrome P450 [Acorus gramineus]